MHGRDNGVSRRHCDPDEREDTDARVQLRDQRGQSWSNEHIVDGGVSFSQGLGADRQLLTLARPGAVSRAGPADPATRRARLTAACREA